MELEMEAWRRQQTRRSSSSSTKKVWMRCFFVLVLLGCCWVSLGEAAPSSVSWWPPSFGPTGACPTNGPGDALVIPPDGILEGYQIEIQDPAGISGTPLATVTGGYTGGKVILERASCDCNPSVQFGTPLSCPTVRRTICSFAVKMDVPLFVNSSLIAVKVSFCFEGLCQESTCNTRRIVSYQSPPQNLGINSYSCSSPKPSVDFTGTLQFLPQTLSCIEPDRDTRMFSTGDLVIDTKSGATAKLLALQPPFTCGMQTGGTHEVQFKEYICNGDTQWPPNGTTCSVGVNVTMFPGACGLGSCVDFATFTFPLWAEPDEFFAPSNLVETVRTPGTFSVFYQRDVREVIVDATCNANATGALGDLVTLSYNFTMGALCPVTDIAFVELIPPFTELEPTDITYSCSSGHELSITVAAFQTVTCNATFRVPVSTTGLVLADMLMHKEGSNHDALATCFLQVLPPSLTPSESLTPSISRSPTPSPRPSLSPVQESCSQCDDGNACTIDLCVSRECVHQPIVCDDGNPCTRDFCLGGVCQTAPVSDGEDCAREVGSCASFSSCEACGSSSNVDCSWIVCGLPGSNATFFNVATDRDNETLMVLYATDGTTTLGIRETQGTGVEFQLGSVNVFLAQGSGNSSAANFLSNSLNQRCLPTRWSTSLESSCQRVSEGECGLEYDYLNSNAQEIGVSAAVAGGSASFAGGACVVALLFYRRKKDKSTLFLHNSQRQQDWSSTNSSSFQDSTQSNPIFHPSANNADADGV